ncbi:MAG: hypothetical protein H6620_02215 [Halobacteriovoraceae bacterium]|nr:hypothetical protein [Halobacteriovoraceae bacterium]
MNITFANFFSTKNLRFSKLRKRVIQDLKPLEYKQVIRNQASMIPFVKNLKLGHPTILLALITTKNDVVNMVNLLKVIHEASLKDLIKIVLFNEIFDPNLDKSFRKTGVDIIMSLDRDPDMISALCKTYARTLISTANEKNHASKSSEIDEFEDDYISFLPALNMKEDVFVFSKNEDFSIHLNRVSLSFLGPAPEVGYWKETSRKLKKVWEFIPNYNNPLASFFYFDTSIIFEGDQPLFDRKINKWIFRGVNIKLYYIKDGKEYYRFALQNNKLNLAKNSQQILERRELLKESLHFSQSLSNKTESEELKISKIDNISMPQTFKTFSGQEISLESGDLELTLFKDRSPLRLILKLEDLTLNSLVMRADMEDNSVIKKLKGQQLKCQIKLKYNKQNITYESLINIDGVSKTIGAYHLTATPAKKIPDELISSFYRLFEMRQISINKFINIARN